MDQNRMNRKVVVGLLGVSLMSLGWAAPAAAHISLERAGTHMSRDGDDNLKEGPCGKAGSKRGTKIYTYEPGATIKISIVEFIPHPGYFRIAFDNDGDDDFEEPASIKPIDPKRKCPTEPTDQCGKSDFYNNDTVLPGMDNLNPHIPGPLDLVNGPKYTWDVKLPDIECDNCTLQIIQVMEDDATHGPYDPRPGVGVADIYHQCIDIVLKKGVGEGGSGTGGDSATTGSTPTAGDGTSGTTGAGGTTGGGATGESTGAVNGSTGSSGVTGSDVRDGGVVASDTSDSGGCAVSSGRADGQSAFVGSLFVIGMVSMHRRRRSNRKVRHGVHS